MSVQFSAVSHVKNLLENMPHRIRVGDNVPDCGLCHHKSLVKDELQKKNILLLTVPNVLQGKGIEEFVQQYDSFKQRGVSKIILIATEKFIHLSRWLKQIDPKDRLYPYADPCSEFAVKLGLGVDKRDEGAGIEIETAAIYAVDGVVQVCLVDADPEKIQHTKASNVLQKIQDVQKKLSKQEGKESHDKVSQDKLSQRKDSKTPKSQSQSSEAATQELQPALSQRREDEVDQCNHAQTPEF